MANLVSSNCVSAGYLPSKCWAPAICSKNNDIYLFGGFNGTFLGDFIKLSFSASSSSLNSEPIQIANDSLIPTPRSNHTLNSMFNFLILYGGSSSRHEATQLNDFLLFNLDSNRWELPLFKNTDIYPISRSYHSASIDAQQRLFIFGGQNESAADLNDLWMLEYKDNAFKWSFISNDGPSSRRFHSSSISENKLYIIGGCHGHYQPLSDIWVFDISTSKWLQHFPDSNFAPRWGHTSVSYFNWIVIFGGRTTGSDTNEIWTFGPDLNFFQIFMKNSPVPRRRHAATFVLDKLLVCGGYNGLFLSDIDIIELNFVSKTRALYTESKKNSKSVVNAPQSNNKREHKDSKSPPIQVPPKKGEKKKDSVKEDKVEKKELMVNNKSKILVKTAISLGFSENKVLLCMDEMHQLGEVLSLNCLLDRLHIVDSKEQEVCNNSNYELSVKLEMISKENEKLKKRLVTASNHIQKLLGDIENLEELRRCKVCMLDPISVVFIPCGHRCVCKACFENFQQQQKLECPICRKRWKKGLKTYD